ncbi:MAG TPA: carboxypeptidase regulatory-like domain-containing protein, partial [Blastocatellia bacterium]|nr:carboxypeptidase regulatory-like domain-containing protein [Blastocatellia bacterium]
MTKRLMRGLAVIPILATSGLFRNADCAGFPPAQANNVILGKVRGTNGVTLNNAIVELRRAGGELMSQTVTRNDGDFSFSGLATGEYEVAVTLSGYESTVEMARFKLPPSLSSIETLRVDIMLKPRVDVLLATPGVNFAQEVPKAARAAFEKGIARLREGKSAEGIGLLNQATSVYGDYFNAHFALANEYYRLEKYNEALQSVERARQINDRESGVYHLFGLVMLKQRKVVVAEYAFREAVRLNGASVAGRFYHGVALTEI